MKGSRAGAAAGYAVIGLVGLLAPRTVPRIFGGDAPTATSRTEIRAVYGGIPLALAAVITRGDASALRTAAAASGGMALARAAGGLIERESRTPATGFFLAVEAALAAALVDAARVADTRVE